MTPILEGIKQFPVAFAIWRVEDQVIVYANDMAITLFGGDDKMIGKATLWDIIGPSDMNLVLLESMRSDPHGGPEIRIPDEAFATFKRIDNAKTFTAWYRAKDIHEHDLSTKFRAALIFANYDTYADENNWNAFIASKASIVERALAATVAHRLNNALLTLTNDIELILKSANVDFSAQLKNSLQQLSDIGLEMRKLAHLSDSLRSDGADDVFSAVMPDQASSTKNTEQTEKLKFLIVDDDHALVSGLTAVMAMRKIETMFAYSSKEAIFKAEAFKPDGVLIDLALGDEDGFELGQKLKEMYPALNIIYMTGFAARAPEIIHKHKAIVLKKPFEIDRAIAFLSNGGN